MPSLVVSLSYLYYTPVKGRRKTPQQHRMVLLPTVSAGLLDM